MLRCFKILDQRGAASSVSVDSVTRSHAWEVKKTYSWRSFSEYFEFRRVDKFLIIFILNFLPEA